MSISPEPHSIFERIFKLSIRNTTPKQEILAGLTTFLSMVYAVILIPNMLSEANFPTDAVFLATCLVTGISSLLMGFWANLPMAIGCAISLTAFTAFSLVLGQNIPIPVVLGAVFLMGVCFTLISVTGLRQWILQNIPQGIAHGTGIGIGLFLLFIASTGINLISKAPNGAMPIALGDINSFSVLCALFGLFAIIGLERLRVPGSILLVIIVISVIGLIFDPNVHYTGFFKIPSLQNSLIFKLNIADALHPTLFPTIFALIITAIFDATGTIRAVAGQAKLIDNNGQIISGNKALLSDSIGSIFSGLLGSSPTAVYIESTTGTAAGGRTGLTAVTVGVLFLFMLFFAPLAYLVPNYATAPALMYVGLLMLSNVAKLDFDDFVDAMSGLVCATFILLTCNIVTGIMLGFCTLVIGRAFAAEWKKLKISYVLITVLLVVFYLSGWAIF